jgi:hypothetical protein
MEKRTVLPAEMKEDIVVMMPAHCTRITSICVEKATAPGAFQGLGYVITPMIARMAQMKHSAMVS